MDESESKMVWKIFSVVGLAVTIGAGLAAFLTVDVVATGGVKVYEVRVWELVKGYLFPAPGGIAGTGLGLGDFVSVKVHF